MSKRAKYKTVEFGNDVQVVVWNYGRIDPIELIQDAYEAHCSFATVKEARAVIKSLREAIRFVIGEQAKIDAAKRSGIEYDFSEEARP